mgnify:CR=1 FL=1
MLAEILHKIAGMEKDDLFQPYRPRPSLAGPKRCIRQLVYLASNTPKDRDIGDRFIHVLNDSSWHEELTADWIRKSAYKFHSEQMKIDCGYGLKGSIDGLITDMLGNEYLYEHKALNHFTFQRYEKGELPLDYFTQCALYLCGLYKINPAITKAILLVKNKNTSAFLEFRLEYDNAGDILALTDFITSEKKETSCKRQEFAVVCRNAAEKFSLVKKHAEEKTLPNRPFEYGTQFPCGYCGWEKTCWAGYEAEHEAKIEDVELAGEVINLARYYCETNMHIKEMEKEKEKLKTQLQMALKGANAKSIKAGDYRVKTTLIHSITLNKNLISPAILAGATVEKIHEVLSVRKTLPKGERDNKKEAI